MPGQIPDDPYFGPVWSEKEFNREKARARELRSTSWWKRKLQKGKCHYCGQSFKPAQLTMDHVIPLSRGGTSTRENLVACCKQCNNQKKNLLPAEWQEYLARLSSS